MIGLRYLLEVSTLKLDVAKCTGCLMCINVCPHAVFALENKKAKIVDHDACMECGACATNCADGAIEVQAGVGCASGIINGMIRGTEPSCGCDSGVCC